MNYQWQFNGAFNEFEGMGGNDTITGNGNTRISYLSAAAGVTVTFSGSGSGTAQGTASGDIAGVGIDTFTGVNAVRGSNFADTFIMAVKARQRHARCDRRQRGQRHGRLLGLHHQR